MSLSAMKWAREIRTGSSTLKQILMELAGYEQGTGEVFPAISTLVDVTELDRKTVQNGLQELVKIGLLRDTGKRAGRTKQIPVYELVGFDPDHVRSHRGDLVKAHRKTPETGTVSAATNDQHCTASQATEDAGEFAPPVSTNSPESGTVPVSGSLIEARVPFSPGNDPAFPTKRSQKRDTERFIKPSEPSDARAPARGSARPRGAEPEQERPRPTAEQILGAWRNRLGPILATEVSLLLWGRGIKVPRSWPTWPTDLQQLFLASLQGVADDAANLEISRGACSPEMRVNADNAAQAAAADVASRYAALAAVAA